MSKNQRKARREKPSRYTAGRFAEALGVTRQTVLNWIAAGKIKFVRRTCDAGKYYQISADQLSRGKELAAEGRPMARTRTLNRQPSD